MIASLVRKRWFVISAATLLSLLIILVVTPVLIRHLAKSWLLENGGEQVQFRDVDFNPFTARLVLEALDVKVDERTTLSFDSAGLDLAWRPLLKKQFNIQSVQLNGLQLVVDNTDVLKLGGITLAGKPDAEPPRENDAEQKSDWLSGIESLTLTDIRVEYRDSKIESSIVLEQAQLSGLTQWAPEQPAHLDVTGTVNGARLSLNAELAPLAATPFYQGSLTLEKLALAPLAPLARPALEQLAGRLSLQSDFRVDLPGNAVRLVHDGRLSVAELQLSAAAARLEVASARLDGETDLSLIDGEVDIANQGDIDIASINLVNEAVTVDNQSVNWAGSSAVRLGGSDKSLTFTADGDLNIGPVAATMQEPDVHIANQRLELRGKVAFEQGADQPAVQLDSDIQLDSLSIATDRNKTTLLELQALSIDELRVESSDAIRAAMIEMKQLVAGPDGDATADPETPSAVLIIARSTLAKPTLADKVFAVDSVRQEGMQMRIHRDNNGELGLTRLIERIQQLGKAPEPDEPAQPAPTPDEITQDAPDREAIAIAIKQFEISQDSRISIVDESVEPVFDTELLLQQVRIEELDSRQAMQPSPLTIEGKIGNHTGLSLKGNVQPFRDPPGMDLQGSISALDLPQLSSYTKQSLGVLLNSGTLNSEISLKSADGSLDGLVTLTLKQLELTGTGAKNSLQSRLPVPLDAALDTLRDKQNTIELKIPVKGDINDPKFSVNDAINQALARGLQKGAFSYLKYALQPYGTLISVAQYAGEQINKVRLNPVEFEPGQFALDDGDLEYLNKVAGVLKERPKIAIKLCGVVVQQDQLALQQAALAQQPQPPTTATRDGQEKAPPQSVPVDEARFKELAQQRADAVKSYLVEQQGISASSLVGCLPQLELDQQAAIPRTDLLI